MLSWLGRCFFRQAGPGELSRGSVPSVSRHQVSRVLLQIAASIILIPLACDFPPTHVVNVTSASASQLDLELYFTGGLVPGSQVSIFVTVTLSGNWVMFSNHQQLTVNGVEVPQVAPAVTTEQPSRFVTVPRPPLGGRYRVVYTDENGRQTTIVIPAPTADLVVISPEAGALVPIPQPVGGPQPTASATPATPAIPGMRRTPQLVDTPLLVRYTLPYSPQDIPKQSFPDPGSMYSINAGLLGPCRQDPQPPCFQVGASDDGLTGNLAFSDEKVRYGAGFENLAPGPGSIIIYAKAAWNLHPAGFSSVRMVFEDRVISPITWVSP